jgi:monofunctional biosynthetic peptidoglycan transglycosylase
VRRREPAGRARGNGTRVRRAALAAALGALLLPALAILVLRWVPPPTSAFLLLHAEPTRHEWVPWPEISREVAIAVIAAEDQRFLVHHGFDFGQISSALSRERGRRRGASTISQQVAKNLFLWPGRSWARKGLEAWLTLWIEALWPKRRILEVYLNFAEFGPGVFGVGAASRLYFGIPARELGPDESARLAAVLPNPHKIQVVDPGPWAEERAWQIRELVAALGGPAYLRPLWAPARRDGRPPTR